MALRRFRFTALLLGGLLVAVVALQGAFQNRQQAGDAFHAQVDYGWDAPVYDDEPAWTDDGYSQDETWSDNDGYQEGAVVSDDDVYYFQDDPVWPDEPWEEPSYPDEPLEEQDTLSSDGESGCTGWCGVPDDCPGECYPSEFLECKYSGWYWYCDFKDDGSDSSEDDQGGNCEQPNDNTQDCEGSPPNGSSDIPDPDCPADCPTYCDPPGHCVVDDEPNETGVCCQMLHPETGGAEQTGLCAITTQEICAGSRHAWVGGDDCSVCGGGDPGIVCCQPDGSCQITRSDFCTGTPGPGQTCVPNPCIPDSDPKVPCCFGTVCVQDVRQSLCEGPTCESGVCPNNEVACCVGGSPWTQSVCTVVTGECASPAGGSTCYSGACGVGGNCDGEGGRDPPCTIGYRCTTMGTCVWVGIESSASSSPFPPVVQPPDIEEPSPIIPLRSAATRTDPNIIFQYTSTIPMDIDGNGVANAADAIILNNYLNGKRGSGLLEGTGRSSGWQSWVQRFLASLIAQQAYRSPQEMEAFIAAYLSAFDLDGDGTVEADTDGTLAVRALAGLDGEALIVPVCDDGNFVAGDGCSPERIVEAGWTCSGLPSVCRQDGVPYVPPCGNGTLNSGEACDDGNTMDGDGCSSTCTVEYGWQCSGSPQSTCIVFCGNGIKTSPETCDDGNIISGDGCSNTCRTEEGWTCDQNRSPVCQPTCGDGYLKGSEKCDDRNVFAGDGCTAECHIEPGYTCTGIPSFCAPTCGDGFVVGREQCDDWQDPPQNGDGCDVHCYVEDGWECDANRYPPCKPLCGDGLRKGSERCDDQNTTNRDGCSSLCTIEPGYACAGTPSICAATCSNGRIDSGENCDDMNIVDRDGCSSFCMTEPGFTCMGTPSVCSSRCGDGIRASNEQCDDGNILNGDGCSRLCRFEAPSSAASVAAVPSFSSAVSSASAETSSMPLCGNGMLEGTEECERGMDTCPAGFSCDGFLCHCALLPVLSSSVASEHAAAPSCGNRVLETGEQCESGVPCPEGSYCTLSCLCISRSASSFTGDPAVSSLPSTVSAFRASVSSAGATYVSPICGNGIREAGEQCERLMPCPNSGICNLGCQCLYPSTGTALRPSLTCGNGTIEAGEQCERFLPCPQGGICNLNCQCLFSSSSVSPSVIPAPPSMPYSCGNGRTEYPEQCDDGDSVDGDGCSRLCRTEQRPALSSVSSAVSLSALKASSVAFSSFSSSSSSVDLLPAAPEPTPSHVNYWFVAFASTTFLCFVLAMFLLLRRQRQREE